MKFLPTIDLWNPAIAQALYNGQLQLQSGQWVQCGNGPKSRFHSASSYSIKAFHADESRTATRKYREYVKGSKEAEKALLEARRIREARKAQQLALDLDGYEWI